MKKFTCYDCEKSFEADAAMSMLNLLYPHYMEEHKEIITGVDEAGKKAWMEKFNKDWEAAEEV